AGFEDAERVSEVRRRQIGIVVKRHPLHVRAASRRPNTAFEIAHEPRTVAGASAPKADSEEDNIHRGSVAIVRPDIAKVPAARATGIRTVCELVDALCYVAGWHAHGCVVPITLVCIHEEDVRLMPTDHQRASDRT